MQASINDIYGELEFRAFTLGGMDGDGTDSRTWVLKLEQGNNDVTVFFNSAKAFVRAVDTIRRQALNLGVIIDE